MGFILFFGVGVGFFAALLATFFIGRRVVAAMMPAQPISMDQRRTIVRGAVAGVAIALLPSLLLGVVVGGTLGGTYGSALAANGMMNGSVLINSARRGSCRPSANLRWP